MTTTPEESDLEPTRPADWCADPLCAYEHPLTVPCAQVAADNAADLGLGAPLELTDRDKADLAQMAAEPDAQVVVGGWERAGTCGSESVIGLNGVPFATLSCNEDAGHDVDRVSPVGRIPATPHRASVLWGNLPIAVIDGCPECGVTLPHHTATCSHA